MNKLHKEELMLSICTVTYNHENYIKECLEGLLNQKTNFKYEILVHDDASTDSTQSIIKECESKHPDKIKAIYQSDNQWIENNINPLSRILLPSAKGKYLAMCEGDDYWIDEYKLQKQVDFLESNPDVNICGHVTRIKIDEGIKYNNEKRPNSNYIGRKLDQEEIVKMMTIEGPSFHTSSFVLRKGALTEIDLLSNSTAGDYVILLNLTETGFAYVLLDEMSVYRKTRSGITSMRRKTNDKNHAFNKINFYTLMNKYTNKKYSRYFTPKISESHKILFNYYISTGSKLKAVRHYLYLITFKISNWKLIKRLLVN